LRSFIEFEQFSVPDKAPFSGGTRRSEGGMARGKNRAQDIAHFERGCCGENKGSDGEMGCSVHGIIFKGER